MGRESITSSVNTRVAKRRAATTYGRRLHEAQALSVYEGENGRMVFETTFNYKNLVDFVLDDKLYNYIPKGSRILSAKLYITQAWVGGTSLTVGTYLTTTGAAVSANGLVTATEAATANLVLGAYIQGAGSQLNAATGSAADWNVKAVAAGTFTAGEATLRIEIEQPVDRYATLNG